MKPAPPKEISIEMDDFLIKSNPKEKHSWEGETKIFKQSESKKTLHWELDIYLGKKKLLLSSDGSTLILIGSKYFGMTVKNKDQAPLVEVYEKGKTKKEFTYRDITKASIVKEVERNKIPVFGGNWVNILKILAFDSIDWNTREIKFQSISEENHVNRFSLKF